jgi:hypothetical protein
LRLHNLFCLLSIRLSRFLNLRIVFNKLAQFDFSCFLCHFLKLIFFHFNCLILVWLRLNFIIYFSFFMWGYLGYMINIIYFDILTPVKSSYLFNFKKNLFRSRDLSHRSFNIRFVFYWVVSVSYLNIKKKYHIKIC